VAANSRFRLAGGAAWGWRTWLAGAVVVILLAAAGCSSSGSSSTSGSSSPSGSAGSGSSSAAATAAPGGDVGITSTQIRVAVIADVNAKANPGLFQKSLNAVKAWASIINASGGLAGRQVVVDAIDSQLDPNISFNDVIQACSSDFALVGTEALALSSTSAIDTCKNAQGQAIGIPNLAGIAFGALQGCDPDTFAVLGNDSAYCATLKQATPSHTEQVGDYRWLVSQYPGLHGVWIYNTDLPTARSTQLPSYEAGSAQGVKKDGAGFYGAAGTDPQSAMTPVVQAVKQYGSTFVSDGVTPPNMVLLRREAQLQGANSVKVWLCSAGCYANYFLQTGGSAVDGTYQTMTTIPFFTEYKQVPELAALVDKLGGITNLDSNALASYVEALLFQDAVQKAVANGGQLTRASLFNALRTQETAFNAGGVIGATNVSGHENSPCFMITQVKNGQWQRVYPTQAGTFDCKASNIITVAQGA
jgi:ABC-type branched-subunit amino acid transport system substrate-binding protein